MPLRISSMGCRSSWEWVGVQLLLLLMLPVHYKATATRGDTAASIVRSISSTAEARLSWPTSLLKGVIDCEEAINKDNVQLQSTIATACWLTSRSVTASQRALMLQLTDQDESTFSARSPAIQALVTSNGLCLLQSRTSSIECNSATVLVAATAAGCCQGTISYYPAEGLLDTLAPVMERLLVSSSSSSRYRPESTCHLVMNQCK
jgi:hypothetical protein